MKPKKFTSTKAKLPDNEMILGGDAHPSLFAKRDIKAIEKDIIKWREENRKK